MQLTQPFQKKNAGWKARVTAQTKYPNIGVENNPFIPNSYVRQSLHESVSTQPESFQPNALIVPVPATFPGTVPGWRGGHL